MRLREELRRVTIAGKVFVPGRHELVIPVSGTSALLTLLAVVGARRGPRVFAVGGVTPEDGLGLAVARGLLDELDPDELGGTVIALGRAAASEHPLDRAFRASDRGPGGRVAALILEHIVSRARAGVVVRAGPAGWATFPHIRADLSNDRVRRLARTFGAEAMVDGAGVRGSLRRAAADAGVPVLLFEGGELGRHEPAIVERAVAGVLNLLRAARMLPETVVRPAWRATLGEVTRVRGRHGGWLVPLAAPGDLIAQGDPLADLHDDGGRSLGVVTAPARAVVLAVPAVARFAARGPAARLGRVVSVVRRRVDPAAVGPTRVGWCEWVSLPGLGIPRLHAKIDTGARTSALHVLSMGEVGVDDGRPVYELRLPIGRRVLASMHGGKSSLVRVVIQDFVVVRDSGGHAERRPVIETLLHLGPVRRTVRVTLTDRGDMLFPMLVGRTALGDAVVVDAAARHLLGEP